MTSIDELWRRWRSEAAAGCGVLSQSKVSSAPFKSLVAAAKKAGIPVFQQSRLTLATALAQYSKNFDTDASHDHIARHPRLPALVRKKGERIMRLQAVDSITRVARLVQRRGLQGPVESEDSGDEVPVKRRRVDLSATTAAEADPSGGSGRAGCTEGTSEERDKWLIRETVPVTGAGGDAMETEAVVTDSGSTDVFSVKMLVGEYVDVMKESIRNPSKRLRRPHYLAGWAVGDPACHVPGDCLSQPREVGDGLGRLVGCSMKERRTDWTGNITMTTTNIVKFRALRPGLYSLRILVPVDFDCWRGTRGPRYRSAKVIVIQVLDKTPRPGEPPLSDTVTARGVSDHTYSELSLDLLSSPAHDISSVY